jgi:hypothetical protein
VLCTAQILCPIVNVHYQRKFYSRIGHVSIGTAIDDLVNV